MDFPKVLISRKFLDEGGRDLHLFNLFRQPSLLVNQGEKSCILKNFTKDFQALFTAPHSIQPVMHQSNTLTLERIISIFRHPIMLSDFLSLTIYHRWCFFKFRDISPSLRKKFNSQPKILIWRSKLILDYLVEIKDNIVMMQLAFSCPGL